jgi:hypothetical protein
LIADDFFPIFIGLAAGLIAAFLWAFSHGQICEPSGRNLYSAFPIALPLE